MSSAQGGTGLEPRESGGLPGGGGAKSQPMHKRMGYALAGLRAAWRDEASIRTEVLALLGWTGVLCWLRPAPVWWALSLSLLVCILAAELLNSALEAFIDHVHPQRHDVVGRAKDMAAGAVFVLVCAALLVGALTVWSVLG
jgi:undecaprenol kinase